VCIVLIIRKKSLIMSHGANAYVKRNEQKIYTH
jgi:hypothetical protein